MLERLLIRNYQKHERLAIEFDPHVTVLVGASDAGKSAVIRALRWVLQNRPRGFGFLRHGATEAEAKLLVDGRVIARTRDNSENLYRVDKQLYKAFVNDPPDDVARLANVGDVNFQLQHDPTFWFSMSSGEVGRELNKIVDLSIIDESLAYLLGKSRAAHAAVDVGETRLAKSKIAADALAWVPLIQSAWVDVTTLHAAAVAAVGAADGLRAATATAHMWRQSHIRAVKRSTFGLYVEAAGGAAIAAGKAAASLSGLVDDARRARAAAARRPPSLDGVRDAGKGWSAVQKRVDGLAATLDDARRARAAAARRPPSLEYVIAPYARVGVLTAERQRLAAVVQSYRVAAAVRRPPAWAGVDGARLRCAESALAVAALRDAVKAVVDGNRTLARAVVTMAGAREALRAVAGDTCPTCGAALTGG